MPDVAPPAAAVLDAMVRGDFAGLAKSFADAGLAVHAPAPGMLRVDAAGRGDAHMRVLLSVGVHGDETAPIELLAGLLAELAAAPRLLRADLLVVVGNLDAIAARRRYIEVDLNRLFSGGEADAGASSEARRAASMMQASRDFFAAPQAGEKWHLDLHTAIRPSQYPTFAVVPGVLDAPARRKLIDWLGAAGIGAAIVNPQPAPTYSAFTATQCGATGCTVELGQVSQLGQNDARLFAATGQALRSLLLGAAPPPGAPPHVFTVVQELVKHSEQFTLAFDRDTRNFTAMQRGELIARDGDIVYRVNEAREYVVFPNPDVAPGKRAGLMVKRVAGQ